MALLLSELIEAEFPLPPRLAGLGTNGRVSLIGRDDAPVVVMIGGISADRHPCRTADGPGWWHGLAGTGRAIDPDRHRIIGLDFAADEEGRRAPSPRDQAELIAAALDHFGVDAALAIVGASYGGMIALAFAQAWPERVARIVVISADASPHPTSTANRELQRRVVRMGMDQGFGEEALGIARGMAMMTYRAPEEFAERFAGGIDGEDPLTCSDPGAYLRARGAAYPRVMSPGRFLSLSASIDRQSCIPERIVTPALLIGATSDRLVPPSQMESLAARLAGPVDLHLLPSLYGHDMFLKEAERIAPLVARHLA